MEADTTSLIKRLTAGSGPGVQGCGVRTLGAWRGRSCGSSSCTAPPAGPHRYSRSARRASGSRRGTAWRQTRERTEHGNARTRRGWQGKTAKGVESNTRRHQTSKTHTRGGFEQASAWCVGGLGRAACGADTTSPARIARCLRWPERKSGPGSALRPLPCPAKSPSPDSSTPGSGIEDLCDPSPHRSVVSRGVLSGSQRNPLHCCA